MAEAARILVVDDEPSVCKAVAAALTTEGHTVDTALSAEEALEKAGMSHFDVVVTDLMMPGLSGMDLLKMAAEKLPEARVIMITGYPSVKSAVEAMRLGAFDFIPKPFTPKEIRGLVSRALASRHYCDETAIVPPSDIHCVPENSWAAVDERGHVRVGIHHLFLRTIPDITSIRLAEEGSVRYQGEACAEVTDSKGNTHKVWSPVSGTVVAVNPTIVDNYAMLLKDPYGEGWLFRMAPANLDDDFKNLVPARP